MRGKVSGAEEEEQPGQKAIGDDMDSGHDAAPLDGGPNLCVYAHRRGRAKKPRGRSLKSKRGETRAQSAEALHGHEDPLRTRNRKKSHRTED